MVKKLLSALALILSFFNYSSAQCIATISGNNAVCFGDTGVLHATPGGVSYQWCCNTVPIPGATDSIYVITVFGYITAIVDFGNCIDTSNILHAVADPPFYIGGTNNNFPVCAGDTLHLSAYVMGGTPPYTSMLTGPNNYFCYACLSPYIANSTTANSGYYIMQGTDGLGCQAIDTIIALVNSSPVVTITGTTSGCIGGTANLTGSGSGGTIPYTYQWSTSGTQPTLTLSNLTVADAGTYTLQITDANLCSGIASTYLSVNASPVITGTYTDPTTNNSNDGTITIMGLASGTAYTVNYSKNSLPQSPVTIVASVGTLVLAGLSVGTYSDITVTLNGCTSNMVGPYVLVATTTSPDSVWPGDVNYDLIADNNDVLDLALAYGQTGTVRLGATNNWVAEYSADWGTLQTNTMDMKHADCNGDGTVDANDTTAISLNYGQTHLKGVHTPQGKSSANPDLYFDLTGINFTSGTTVSVPVKLGTTAMPMSNILGIATKVHVSGVTLNNAPTIDATTSWMGTTANLLNFTKGVNTNQTDWTLARTDHNNVSGDGTIATLTMDIPAGSAGQDVVLYFDDVKIIDNGGNAITNVNIIDDTASIVPVNVDAVITNIQYAAVVPNPSGAQASLQVSLAQASTLDVNITDVTGRNIWSKKATASTTHYISLPADVSSGIYIIQIKTSTNGAAQSLKWVKK